MAAITAVGVAKIKEQGQKTTRTVTARMISPVTLQVIRAEASAVTTTHVAMRSASLTILALPASVSRTSLIRR